MIVLRRALHDARRSAFGWSIGVIATVLLTAAFYPSLKGQTSVDDVVKDLPEAVRNMIGVEEGLSLTSPAGFLNARLFALTVPVLLLIYAIGLGSRAIGGSEADGTLEYLLANPVSRRRVLIERYLSITALLGGVTAVFLVALLVVAAAVGLLEGVSVIRVVVATVAAALLALAHATVAFAVGAARGRPGAATAVATSVASAGYLIQSLAEAADGLRPFAVASPWHWYADQNIVRHGVPAAAVLGPLAVTAVLVVAAAWAFDRRDLR